MNFIKRVKKIKRKVEQNNSDLHKWKKRLEENKEAFSTEYEKMPKRKELYDGTRKIENSTGRQVKPATNVRNIIFELIESQIDSNIPMPKVTAAHPEDVELAAIIEDMIKTVLDKLPFEELNDEQERTTPIQGCSLFLVEWNNFKKTHTTVGDIAIANVQPKQFVPQNGVYNIHDSDYMFIQIAKTKEQIKKKYDIDVEDEETDETAMLTGSGTVSEDVLTENIAYYRNKNGGIGVFSWVNDIVLSDIENYQSRLLERCEKCGAVKTGDICECGGKKFTKKTEEFEEITQDIILRDGEVVPATTEQAASQMMYDEMGSPYMGETVETTASKIPYYNPEIYPIIMRKNVSVWGKMFGNSDVDVIETHQEAIKKLGTKIEEKILKGGSYVTLPVGVSIDTTDAELKILRVETQAQRGLISVINVQPDIGQDRVTLEDNYQWAKSTLGINDSFQGKADSTANSGRAKEFSAAQAAGRLESKRKMKHAAYQKLFETIFKFMLAYSDEPRSVKGKDDKGHMIYKEFNRYDFLKRDVAGELYWEDDFLFSVDSTGGLSQNREAMWEEANGKFTSGAFGDPTDVDTQIIYWSLLEELQYPMSATIKQSLEDKKAKLAELAATQEMEQGIAQGIGQPIGEMKNIPQEQPIQDFITQDGGPQNAMFEM